jgi:hypothetical protein
MLMVATMDDFLESWCALQLLQYFAQLVLGADIKE